jgi:hypothetical protein
MRYFGIYRMCINWPTRYIVADAFWKLAPINAMSLEQSFVLIESIG